MKTSCQVKYSPNGFPYKKHTSPIMCALFHLRA
nr:MAG TPA: hypothetical protein [Caudoviricetes sp.]